MPQDKNHLTASTQAKNGSLYAVIQYKDETGKRKNKWKSLGLKEGASKAKINTAKIGRASCRERVFRAV